MFYLKMIFTQNKTMPLEKGINIITGYTGQNKTLFYTAVEYVFCVSSNLGISLAINSLNSDFVGVVLTDDNVEYVLKRNIGTKFEAYINGKEYLKMDEYKKAINKCFGFLSCKISNADKANTFNSSDYMGMIFIPESQLTNQKNVFEKNGYSDKGKYIAFFKYILTGLIIDEKIEKKTNDLERNFKRVANYKTAVNYFLRPNKADSHKREVLISSKKAIENQIALLKEENKKIVKDLEEKKIVLYRLRALKKTYESDISDCIEAGYFEDIENMCNSDCISPIDFSYYEVLKKNLEEIDSLLVSNSSYISSKEDIVSANIEDIKAKEKELSELDNALLLTDNIRIFDDCINTIEIVSNEYEKQKNETSINYESQKQKIESNFKENIKLLCNNVLNRIHSWGINVESVDFDYLNYDFLFDNEAVKYVPKGKKSIFTFALNFEIHSMAKKSLVNVPDFIMIDTLWVATSIKDFDSFDMKQRIVQNIRESDTQIILFENENQNEIIPNCHYYNLDF